MISILWTGTPALAGNAVPHHGSPYRDMADLKTGQILHLPTGVPVSLERMMDVVSTSRVIYVGETHDNLEAHRVQLEVIRSLFERFPGKVAIGMEMFRRSAQSDLDAWRWGELGEKSFRRLFHRNWGMNYTLYQPIFDYSRANRIPLIGLKSTVAMEQSLRENGPGLPGMPEIDFDDPYHREYSLSMFGGNSTHTEKTSKPYQMLLLWEEAMAETVTDFLREERYRDWKLVVLAGGFHVQYGFGIPKRAFRREPHPYSIILPVVTQVPEELKDREMEVKSVDIPLYSADFGWKVDYRVLPRKKIRLGVMLNEMDAGLLVSQVQPHSNAQRMGMQKGDIIVALEGEPLMDTEDLSMKLQGHEFGDRIRLKVLRDHNEVELTGTLEKPRKQPHPHQ